MDQFQSILRHKDQIAAIVSQKQRFCVYQSECRKHLIENKLLSLKGPFILHPNIRTVTVFSQFLQISVLTVHITIGENGSEPLYLAFYKSKTNPTREVVLFSVCLQKRYGNGTISQYKQTDTDNQHFFAVLILPMR